MTDDIYFRYYTQANKSFRMPDGTVLVTIVKNRLALLKAPVQYRDFLLSQRCGCCGNSHQCFRVASEAEVAEWLK